jgi:hypothetical protein
MATMACSTTQSDPGVVLDSLGGTLGAGCGLSISLVSRNTNYPLRNTPNSFVSA